MSLRIVSVAACAATAFLAASAGMVLFAASAAWAQTRILDEVRFGVFQHDTPALGTQKEHGADINVELVFPAPAFLSVIWSPRPYIGGLINEAGYTSQGYFGIDWTFTVAQGLLRPQDSVFVEFGGGGSVNDGKTEDGVTRKALGSHILFRATADLGYRPDDAWWIGASFNHESNAGLGRRNQGLNDAGLRIGIRM